MRALVGYSVATLGVSELTRNAGWILVWMCVLSLMFFVCSLRTNIALVTIFFSLVGVFGTLAGAYFFLAANFDKNSNTAGTFVKVRLSIRRLGLLLLTSCEQAGGVCGFIASMATWWFLLSTLLETVDFPFRLPLGDLSGWIEPASARRAGLDV